MEVLMSYKVIFRSAANEGIPIVSLEEEFSTSANANSAARRFHRLFPTYNIVTIVSIDTNEASEYKLVVSQHVAEHKIIK